jgi:hypothetical protein
MTLLRNRFEEAKQYRPVQDRSRNVFISADMTQQVSLQLTGRIAMLEHCQRLAPAAESGIDSPKPRAQTAFCKESLVAVDTRVEA